jgi:hypothetical protein
VAYQRKCGSSIFSFLYNQNRSTPFFVFLLGTFHFIKIQIILCVPHSLTVTLFPSFFSSLQVGMSVLHKLQGWFIVLPHGLGSILLRYLRLT